MKFLAFNLEDFHKQRDAGALVGVKFFGANNLEKAKDFMRRHYPETAWAVVPKRTFDKGIVLAELRKEK